MELLKKLNSCIKATSLLESVIALCIISISLYATTLVLSMVFTPKTSPKFYCTQNQMNELFYELQLNEDSIVTLDTFQIEFSYMDKNLKKVKINFKDSSKFKLKQNFYLLQNEDQ
ncbi:hypothetical protein [Flavobacterium oreochromis]|uniref:Type II secretion system protein n=1 Tax=Flavobacterium columnare TaxID=996 RepID=A0A246GE30_9FLAO|nr:hypothetical protein [Flavobacterium oreochromis]OWP79669.1 hypothetical protein BWK62_00055 [Flavobacterium oreochromis]QYS87116.1 hypothetical protein JJC03_03905 [Flavobacterium oreochromis]